MFSPGRKAAVVLALVLVSGGALVGLTQLRAVRAHQPTTGTVTAAQMDSYNSGVGARASGETTYYRPNVTYEYTVDGETYTSENIAFGKEIDTNSRDRATGVLSKFDTGSSVTVYYDPTNPADAYLIPRLDFFPAGGLVVSGLLLFADALTPWSRVARLVLARVPLAMRAGGRFAAESPNAPGADDPTAILEARASLDAPRTAPLWGRDASMVWILCGLGIILTVLAYLGASHPPYDVLALLMLGIPTFLVVRVFARVAFGR